MLKEVFEKWRGRSIWLTSDHDADWSNGLAIDEYVDHLRHVVGGWLPPGNLDAIDYSIKHMPPGGAVVEVGTFLGLSATIIAYALYRYRPGTPFFTCDPFRFAGSDRPKAGYFHTGSEEYRNWVMDGLRRNLHVFCRGIEPFVVEAFSEEFFNLWGEGHDAVDVLGRQARLGGGISFAYIDGDHTYNGVSADFRAIEPFLLPGAYLFFDDSADDSSYDGIRRLMSELRRHPDFQPVMKSPNYCFRKRA